MLLKLTRRGKFTVKQAGKDETQCGIRGTRNLYYRVELTCSPQALDENGFLIDQLKIKEYMEKSHEEVEEFLSCEKLAMKCLEDIRGMCEGVMKMEVTIGANKEAFMTASWNITD